MNPTCPPEEQLLAVAADESDSVEVLEHVEHCSECQMRVKMLSGEIRELRSLSNFVAVPQTNVARTEPKLQLSNTYIPAPDNSPSNTATTSRNTPLPNATLIDRYVTVANLGSGGQADVYRVIDRDLGRYLVLKLSHRQSSDANELRNALLAEGRLLADLDHPGLIRIFDVGIYLGRPYLVLEHVSGRNLEQTFSERRPSSRESARLISEVAQVVDYAHRRGVVHGDITPRNILIDDHGRARLIDFGLSWIEDAWGERGSFTGGTPEFLSPEAITETGLHRQSGPASDIFGLGATLYWLLTGFAPFEAATVAESLERASRGDIDFALLHRVKAPRRVTRICQQALAIDPTARPAPHDFASELQRACRPWITPRRALGIIAILVAACALTWQVAQPKAPEAREVVSVFYSAPTINVFHTHGIRTLSNQLPLRTGDRIAIWCNIAPGYEAEVLWFTGSGELKRLTPTREIAGKLDRLTYPTPHSSITLEAPEGTEMIFFCRGGPVSDADVSACFPAGGTVPSMPQHNWLTMLRSDVKIEGPLKSEVPAEIVQLERIMKEIDRKLRRRFQGVTGVAFPHQGAAAEPR